MRAVLALLVLVASACGSGSTLSGASPTPSATSPGAGTASPTATPTGPAAPTRLPGSVVRLSVNGVEYPISAYVNNPGDGPLTIVLTFPFAMDRQSVERWGMPASGTKTWLDDRTLRVVFPETESLGFKIAETQSAGGDAVIDFFIVNVTFPATRIVSAFTIAELAAAGNNAPRTSSSWRVRSDDGITLSPDAKRVLIYDGFGPPSGQVPTFIELATKTSTPLASPPASDGWLSFVDWMADGRLVMVGRGVWVGDSNAGNMKRIVDADRAVGGYPWIALPDPSEKRIALWAYNSDGHIALVDLTSGAVQLLTGPFRRCAADGRPSFAWASDGRLLAGTDCDGEEGPFKARVRIVDVAADRTVRTIEGGTYGITGLPTGNFVLVRDSGEIGQGARLLGVVMGFDGQERRRFLGGGWQMSLDGRYMLQNEVSAAGCCGYTLFDLVAGTQVEFSVTYGGRSEGPRSSPHWLRDGRLAFY
ncbi:MAG: hypothetical protein M3O80_05380 [Chloroflexota bacterium]|nr:hypothetical protein [Chloroflexota bacterium]